jgi:hypothetical protein
VENLEVQHHKLVTDLKHQLLELVLELIVRAEDLGLCNLAGLALQRKVALQLCARTPQSQNTTEFFFWHSQRDYLCAMRIENEPENVQGWDGSAEERKHASIAY